MGDIFPKFPDIPLQFILVENKSEERIEEHMTVLCVGDIMCIEPE
jgi:hypothetical protein